MSITTNIAKSIVNRVFDKADILVGGDEPQDITVHDEGFSLRVLTRGSLGLGKSYMEGWWDCNNIDQFFEKLLKNGTPFLANMSPNNVWLFFKSMFTDLAPKSKAFVIGEEHYDLGNSLFERMLDPSMSYSCGYWPRATTLEEAQYDKYELICKKLNLQPGDRVLDVGCGWGGLAYHMATKYKVNVIGLTVSEEQATYARNKCKGLPVEILKKDYRDEHRAFHHIVSVGMFEHVGRKNYRTFMKMISKNLLPNGLILLHTIGAGNGPFHGPDPWIKKEIFPIGETPTRKQIIKSSKGLLEIRDWHEFGLDYDRTLMAWYQNFVQAWIPYLRDEYEHRDEGMFFRKWKYYLLMCAGSFRAKNNELWQIVLSHPDKHQDYQPVR
jgi:cyclopropane-fatty-acyl-phospholipid synthase